MTENHISQRYVRALLKLIKYEDLLDSAQTLELLVAAVNHKRIVHTFFDNPVVTEKDKKSFLKDILKEIKINKNIERLALLLIEKKRLRLIIKISAEFSKEVSALYGMLHIHVNVAESINEKTNTYLLDNLKKASGKDVEIDESVEDDLIGGASIRHGYRLYDFSIKGKLDALKEDFESL
ncbi:MAG: ATP synthase F1 subunit delta [Spirochaetes bacterium]|nr:ATP synthase F1 subunit delta [Spirochaetota bacterium]